jgi:NAD(P)-dependent dehydrogenase (short-subunit alcohol dehydrogenase family)
VSIFVPRRTSWNPHRCSTARVGAAGRPGEVDRTLLMPVDPASEYVTGQVIAVDGGLTAQ